MFILEKDLNNEIDRLLRITGEQKKKIAELEYQITTDKVSHGTGDFSRPKDFSSSARPDVNLDISPTKSKGSPPVKVSKSKIEHKKTCKKVTSAKQSQTQTQKKDTVDSQLVPPLMLAKCCCEAGGCLKTMKELLDKEMEYRQVQVRRLTFFILSFWI